MLKLVYSANLRFAGVSRERSIRSLDMNRGHSLIGKTAILHIVISGSIPDDSNSLLVYITYEEIFLFCFYRLEPGWLGVSFGLRNCYVRIIIT